MTAGDRRPPAAPVEPAVAAGQPVPLAALHGELRSQFAAAGIDSPGREAAWLLAALLGTGEAAVLAAGDRRLDPRLAARALALGRRRVAGEPFAYLVGSREFWGRRFAVDARVLVPRPETEELVAAVLALDLAPAARVLDLGTGSGAIAVTIALERPDWRVVAADISPAALAVAAANARALGAPVHLLASDLLAAIGGGGFAAVAANLPYIAALDAPGLPATVLDFEPALALFGGEDGLAVIDRLLTQAAALASGCHLVLEVGADQAQTVAGRRPDLLTSQAIVADAAGVPRVVVLKRR